MLTVNEEQLAAREVIKELWEIQKDFRTVHEMGSIIRTVSAKTGVDAVEIKQWLLQLAEEKRRALLETWSG